MKLKQLADRIQRDKLQRLEKRNGPKQKPEEKRAFIKNLLLTGCKEQFVQQKIVEFKDDLQGPVLPDQGTLLHVAVKQGMDTICDTLLFNSNLRDK